MRPAKGQNNGGIQAGQLFVGAITIAHENHHGRIQPRKMSHRYCRTPRGRYLVVNNFRGSGNPEIPAMTNLAVNSGKNLPAAFIVMEPRFTHLMIIPCLF